MDFQPCARSRIDAETKTLEMFRRSVERRFWVSEILRKDFRNSELRFEIFDRFGEETKTGQ